MILHSFVKKTRKIPKKHMALARQRMKEGRAMADRPTFESFKEKALNDPEVRAAYDEAAPAFAMKRDMIAMRTAAGKTQEEMAVLLGNKKSNISRLESVNNDISPRLATVEEYARALGYRMKVEFEPAPGKGARE